MLKKWILIFSLVLSLGLVWAQGSENFTNSAATATYLDGSFVGNGGITWTYGHSRNEGDYPIDGNGLMLRRASDSYLQATIPGGIGQFSFQYRKAFTGTSERELELYINDVVVGTTGAFGTIEPDPTVYTFTQANINTPGMVTIKIKNVGVTSTNRQTVIDNIAWTGFAGGTPTIFASGTFTDFSTFTGTPSASQSYALSGSSLSTGISITAPTGFQVSVDNLSFSQSTSVASGFSGSIFVRLSGASAGNFSGNIAHTSTGADPVNLAVSGTVQNPTPTITLTGTLNNFNTTPGTPSATQSYTVEGVYLSGNISIAAPTGFEISLSQTEGFAGSLQLIPTSGTVAPTQIYVRLTGAEAGAFSGDISHSSSGATTQNMAVNGNVATAPTAIVLLRPAQISLADATHQSAVLVQVENYPSDDFRYRLYNGSNQYYPWRADTGAWISSTSYSAGPQIPGTPSSSVSWWIPFQIGSNPTVVASYRDRQGPSYGSPNFQTAALPTATEITTPVPILSSQVNFNTWNDYTEKYIVLAYDATETLIAASSTDLDNGAFTVLVEDGTTITRIEIRDVMNTLIEAVNGTWPQVLNPEIILSSNALDPLYNVSGQPSDEHGYGSYTVSGQDLTENIIVVAPTHFEIAVDIAGPWESDLSLAPTFNNTIYVRLNSEVVGEHSGDITHNSTGAAQVSVRVEGETLAPEGEIIVNSTMTPFYQEVGTPSVAQSYSLSSNDLSGDITITTSAPFELSLTGTTGWATEINVSDSYNGLIYVRLNADVVGEHTGVEITHTNVNASPVTITVSGTVSVPAGPVDNLFFSEYIEGSSNNKAIEIYNASGQSVDLSRYQVELYRNGAATPENTLIMSGILAAGEVYVIANSEAITGIQDQADVFSTVTYFNGDDALALRCLNPDTLIDVIGTIGTDPGAGWAVAGVGNATVEHTLVRKPTVATGSTDWASQQGTDADTSQWTVFPQDTYSDLGTHTYSSGVLASPAVTITQNGTNVLLAWPDVDGAAQYRVESSDNPYTGFTTLGTTNDITYSTPASPAKKFFRVIALP